MNIYRALSRGRQLEITRERVPDKIDIESGATVVHWKPCAAIQASLTAKYQINEEASAVDVVFSAHFEQNYPDFELFIANYFTPYFTPRYAVTDNRTHPDGVFWYEKKWYNEDECESWARDKDAESVFSDGRWTDGYPLNWRRGPRYAYPLMTQQHRHGFAGGQGAIVLMARREDCFGISGYNAYHNAQYLHLWGRDVEAGEHIDIPVRMVMLTQFDNLQESALAKYETWTEALR
ncbi:MAG: hypothetical protein HOH43_15030 [Candidatus Latescibacteria bacterium]|nr:hypothetical protein [Candidatus Latescibacterota bacterium]